MFCCLNVSISIWMLIISLSCVKRSAYDINFYIKIICLLLQWFIQPEILQIHNKYKVEWNAYFNNVCKMSNSSASISLRGILMV